MTWVKICGITNLEDAQIAIDAGADALGFIFYEKSPRRIDPETAKRIVAELPVHIEKVGVFVLQDSESAAQIVEGLTSLQIHVRLPLGVEPNQGSELVAVAAARPRKFYLAMPAAWFLGESPVTANLSSFIEKRPERPFDRILLDSGTPEQPGGTGKTFDWEKAAPRFEQMSRGINVIVAGGLNPANVSDAIRIMKPWGVDVASG
ncbi:MAG: phosphoribosylanthranilate isomerase, partial [Terriglobales bacterium]